MTLDKGNTDKLSEFRNEARRLGIRVEPPVGQPFGRRFRGRGRRRRQPVHPLRALRGQGRRRGAGRCSGRCARGGRPFTDLGDFAARISIRARSTRRCSKASRRRAPSMSWRLIARASFAAIEPILALANRREEERSAGQAGLFDAERADPLAGIKVETWSLAERLQREFECRRLLPLRPSARCLRCRASAAARAALGRFCPGGEAGRLGRPACRRPCSTAPSGAPNPAARWASCNCRTSPANMRPSCFRKGSTNIATFWKRARPCSSRCRRMSRARTCARASSPSSRSIRRRAGVQKGLRIFLRDPAPLASIAQRPCRAGRGRGLAGADVTGGGEVEVKLPGRYAANANVASSLKTIPGILNVEYV